MTVLRSLSMTIAFALCTAAGARAADLPFVPPPKWDATASRAIPYPVIGWEHGASGFVVSALPVPMEMDAARMRDLLAGQSKALGTITARGAKSICGHPAAQLSVSLAGNAGMLREQMSYIDDSLYITAYRFPAGETSDPAIETAMATFCGAASTGKIVRPAGWTDSDARVLGIWSEDDPKQVMALLARAPSADIENVVAQAVDQTIPGTTVSIVSKTTQQLCGKPATFVTAKAITPDTPVLDLRIEITQSNADAYLLIFGHDASLPVSDAATASLASLCARDQRFAEHVAPLPYVAPYGWRPMLQQTETAFVDFSDSSSNFSILDIDEPIDEKTVLPFVQSQAVRIDPRGNARAFTACGHAAAKFSATSRDGKTTVEGTFERAGDRRYFARYFRPVGTSANADVRRAVEGLCALHAVTDLAPPAGWSDSGDVLAKLYLPATGHDSLVSFSVLKPFATYGGFPKYLTYFALENASTAVASRVGTLCGRPATFVSLKTPGDPYEQLKRIEYIEDGDRVYSLSYMRDAGAKDDVAAIGTLASFCVTHVR